MVPTKCPNEGCEEMIPNTQMPSHLDDNCLFTVLQCRYSEVGCKVELPRKDLEEHEDDSKLHLQILTKYSTTSLQEVATSQQKAATSRQEAATSQQEAITSLQLAVDKLKTDKAYLMKEMNALSVTTSALQKR